MSGTLITLAEVIDESLSALDSLTALLTAGGHDDVAAICAGLLRDTRARLQSAARCLEAGCGRQMVVVSMGDVLCPVPCACTEKKACRANCKAASSY